MSNFPKSIERRRKPGSDLVLILKSFRDGFRGSFARTVLAFAAAFVSQYLSRRLSRKIFVNDVI